MSGVKNLRAMFEQKNDPTNSPPDRGRSPGPGTPSFGSPTPSSRPLSKVRTNFVAVEKDGRVGLRREPSRDSVSVSSRRFSNETESTTPAPIPESDDVFGESLAMNATAFKTNLAREPIPESPSQGPAAHSSPKKGTETPEITPCPNPDKIVDEEETKTKLTSADPTLKDPVNNKPAAPNGTAGSTNKAKTPTTASKAPTKLTAPISTSTKTATKPLKSPLAAKAPKSPAKDTAKPPAKVTERKSVVSTTHKDVAPKPVSSKTTIPAKKPAPPELAPSGGFVKPKPKSPTRPAKLPSGLTAPTASSASKSGGGAAPSRQSLSRASGNVSPPVASHKTATGSGTSNTTTGASTGKTLRRQASTINRSRPSLGPPPKLPAKDHPPVRKDGHVDEGFLARMMRPTQASSSKTADKTPVTPPRKSAAPTAIKKSSGQDNDGGVKKGATKPSEPLKKDTVVKKAITTKAEVKRPGKLDSAKAAGPSIKTAAVTQKAEANHSGTAIKTGQKSADPNAASLGTAQEAERSTTPTEPVPVAATPSLHDIEREQPTHTSEEPMVAEAPSASGTSTVTAPATTEGSLSKEEEATAVEEPSAAMELGTMNELETADKVEETAGESGLSSTEEVTEFQNEDEEPQQSIVVQEETTAPSSDKTAPVVVADPEKVADIEDVVENPSVQRGDDSA